MSAGRGGFRAFRQDTGIVAVDPGHGPVRPVGHAAMERGMTDWSYRAVAWVYSHDAGVLPEHPETGPVSGH